MSEVDALRNKNADLEKVSQSEIDFIFWTSIERILFERRFKFYETHITCGMLPFLSYGFF